MIKDSELNISKHSSNLFCS